MKKTLIVTLIALTLILLSGCAGPATFPEGLTELTLYLAFRPDVQFTPFYVAIEEGFFAENGLAVTLEHASESEMVRLVGTGEAPFAIVSGEQVLLSRAQGVPVRYVFAWYQKFPVAIASKTALGIENPADLAGHSVGTPMLEGASYIGLEALLASAGLTDADISLEVTGFTQVETLISDRVDAVVIYASNEPVQLAAADVEVNLIAVSDYAELVSNGLITSEKVIAEQPELIRAMLKALTEAIAFTQADPDAAFVHAARHVEGLADPAIEATQKAVLSRSITLWEADRIGESRLEAWTAMGDLLLKIGLLANASDLSDAYTNEFLPD